MPGTNTPPTKQRRGNRNWLEQAIDSTHAIVFICSANTMSYWGAPGTWVSYFVAALHAGNADWAALSRGPM
jgi:hypothetical protein